MKKLIAALFLSSIVPAMAQPAPGAGGPGGGPGGRAPAGPPVIITIPSSVCAINCTFTQRQPGADNGDLSFPNLRLVEGQPIEIRDTELPTDKPVFPNQTRAPYHVSGVNAQTTIITNKLQWPWGMQFLPDGKFLVTEKIGNLRVVSPDGTMGAPVSGVPAVHFNGQQGLWDIALDPKFKTNHRIFFSYLEDVDPVKKTNGLAVASATFDEAANALNDLKVIYRTTPAIPGGNANNGGRIAIAKDGSLFVTVGERGQGGQITNIALGTVIHITPDGKPAKDNPFIDKAGYLPEIWSMGHRSEEGLAFNSATGKLWETEHGPRGGDELNLIKPGLNYGWPLITHGKNYNGQLINGGLTEKDGLVQPNYYWDPVIAPSGLAIYNGKLFPKWKGSVLVGGMRGLMLDRLTIKDDKVVYEEPVLAVSELKLRIRDVRVGPDGAIYLLTDEEKDGKLIKVTPKM